MNQRWRNRRSSFRRPDEQIRTADYEVGEVEHAAARDFILRHHYAGSYPAARFRFGLYRHDELAGVAVFSHPVNDRTLTSVFGGAATESVELGRFVLLDDVPGNGETWFLARCLRVLRREGLRGVVSFSDPLARKDAAGNAVFPGHVGTIYQAGNATYLGRGTATALHLLPDATVLSKRAMSKVRNGEQGRGYVVRTLVAAGADDPTVEVGRLYPSYAAWLEHWMARLTRKVKHPGCHKYAFPLWRRDLNLVSLPYPKKDAA